MLVLKWPETEDESALTLKFEHSLVSLSKWEMFHEKPFAKEEMTSDELVAYVQCMLLDEQDDDEWMSRVTTDDFIKISEYINSKQTATWFKEINHKGPEETVTSELIYYWMIALAIPFECQYWHLNRLMTLINICGIKQAPPKKMSRQAQAEEYRRLNEARRKQLGTSG